MKIAIYYKHYPVAMGRYIHWGLEEAGHEVYSIGPYYQGRIPWGDGMYFPDHKYPPYLETPKLEALNASDVLSELGFKPDLLIQAADNWYLRGKVDIPNIVIGTDPHVVDYHDAIKNADKFVSMQNYVLEDYPAGSIYMPYGYVKKLHRNLPLVTLKHHVVCIGLQYDKRQEFAKRLRKAGYEAFFATGYIYEHYVREYNKGLIAFNFSSKEDLPARFWEGMAMKRAVMTNRVPDLKLFDFEEGVDYLAYDTLDEAFDKADYYLKNQKYLLKIADNGYKKVQGHHYKNRVEKMLLEGF